MEDKSSYLVDFHNTNYSINGRKKASSNKSRYMNHSHNPNTQCVEKENTNKNYLMLIYSIRKIKAGEELTWNYGFNVKIDEKIDKCFCGAKKCPKLMLTKLKCYNCGKKHNTHDCP